MFGVYRNLLSRPELLPANDAIRNALLFEAVRSHPTSRCRERLSECDAMKCAGPGFDRCGKCLLNCRPYRRLIGEAV
jgi:hypothetical protein